MSCDEPEVVVFCDDTPEIVVVCDDEVEVVVSCERGPAGPPGPPGTIDPWDAATNYPADAVVSYSGSLYVSLRATIGDQPDLSPLDWQLQGSAVDSVNGQTGAVVLDAGDIGFTPYSTISATNVQTAIQEVVDEISGVTEDDIVALAVAL
jgi:hypothetical protein